MNLIRKQWFLIVLLLALVSGYFGAAALKPLADASWLKWSIVTATMFCMAWPLEFGSLYRAMTQPLAPCLATLINFAAIPLMAWPLSGLLGAELGPGLIVTAAIPSTLASAAVWTRRAGGDDSVAMMVTVITNGLCFLVTPAIVYLLMGQTIQRHVLIGTIYKLLVFVVLPIGLGQLARINMRSAQWATARKQLLSLLAQIGILIMVLIGAVNTGLRVESTGGVGLTMNLILMTLVIVTVIHLAACGGGMAIGRWLGLPRGQWIAVGFAGSQKTLMVGLSTALSMGLNIIPMVAYHAIQLIVDTVIADQLTKEKATVEHVAD